MQWISRLDEEPDNELLELLERRLVKCGVVAKRLRQTAFAEISKQQPSKIERVYVRRGDPKKFSEYSDSEMYNKFRFSKAQVCLKFTSPSGNV
jgi:hypothetical protein